MFDGRTGRALATAPYAPPRGADTEAGLKALWGDGYGNRSERYLAGVAYLDGPFQHLDNVWTFRDVGENACEVGFSIDYAFRNRMLGALMGAMFDKAFRKFAEAFEKRADEVYGR